MAKSRFSTEFGVARGAAGVGGMSERQREERCVFSCGGGSRFAAGHLMIIRNVSPAAAGVRTTSALPNAPYARYLQWMVENGRSDEQAVRFDGLGSSSMGLARLLMLSSDTPPREPGRVRRLKDRDSVEAVTRAPAGNTAKMTWRTAAKVRKYERIGSLSQVRSMSPTPNDEESRRLRWLVAGSAE